MSISPFKSPRNCRLLLLWSARIWATIILAFVGTFLLANIYGALVLGEKSESGFMRVEDILTFLCFPLGNLLGLALAYKWERLGGILATCSLVLPFVVQLILLSIDQEFTILELKGLLSKAGIFFFFIMPPGILYLIYGMLKRKTSV